MAEEIGIPVIPGQRDTDGLHKRRGIWHYKLNVAGRWKEFSTHTRNYNEARKVYQKAVQAQEEGRLPSDKGKWPLEKAAAAWLVAREKDRLAENTRRIERERMKPLLAAFRGRKLHSFTINDVKTYQQTRGKTVGPRTINLEMKLTTEQERHLFETAGLNPAWDATYFAGLLAVNTTMRGGELKGLRLRDVDLLGKAIAVQRATTKTDAGRREIPLNETALWAVGRLVDRARTLGASQPEHYLFPAFKYRLTKSGSVGGSGHDPTKHMKTWRTAWRSLRKAAGLPTLRFHDLRHTCITKLAEAGVPDHVLMSISGHISPEMIKHYSHIRSKAKEQAVAAIQSYSPIDATRASGVRPN